MKIFISHSSDDKWVARQISRLLGDVGCESFLDEKDIKTGDSIDDSIQTHLKDSDHLLVVVSPSSLKSQWVFVEIGGAKALGKRIVPILFHVAPNEVPPAIAKHLARDINEFDRYIAEVTQSKTGATARRRREKNIKKKVPIVTTRDGFSVGEEVQVIDVSLLTESDKNASPKWVPEMNKYSAATAKIESISWQEEGDPDIFVRLTVDAGEFHWPTRWIRKLA
ncbi:MAG: toll/interleukin-1 receptor domain-containing protein [Candidatus Udaeobacter sp.]